MSGALIIREIDADEFGLLWPIFHEVVAAGDTYSYAPDTSFAEAANCGPLVTRVASSPCSTAPASAATCCTANQPGLGNHIANCGYMVSPAARGQGIASAMVRTLTGAGARGGFSPRCNSTSSSARTRGAVRLWQKHGFEIIGRIPNAFRHARLGLVDALIMFRRI